MKYVQTSKQMHTLLYILLRWYGCFCVTYRRVLDWMIVIVHTLYTVIGATGNYSAIAILHTSKFPVAHTLGFSVYTSRILATDFITVSLSLQITHEVFFAPPNYSLAIILQLPT
jgi:hypothetical protein